jgi:hypothetical protein
MPWNAAHWGADRQPWNRLDKDPESHQLAGRFHASAKAMVIDVAAALGVSSVERLFSAGDEYRAAWAELESAARKRVGNPDKPAGNHAANNQAVTDEPDGTLSQLTSKQRRLLFSCLHSRLTRWVAWRDLPDGAFQDPANIEDETYKQALKRLRSQLNKLGQYDLEIRESDRTARLSPLAN